MQKFTIFSAILSLSIILVIGDVLTHGYHNAESTEEIVEEAIETLEDLEEIIDPNEEPPIIESTPTKEEPNDNESVDLSSESTDLKILIPNFTEDLLLESGFFDPVLKDSIYSGFVFQFIPYTDADAFVYQWNVFDGETYIGSIYEMKYPNETASFQGYLALRQAGSSKTDIGTVNEVNNYKDASFYFNHNTKTQTVHLVIRSGQNVYAYEYAHRYHESMKNLFNLVP